MKATVHAIIAGLALLLNSNIVSGYEGGIDANATFTSRRLATAPPSSLLPYTTALSSLVPPKYLSSSVIGVRPIPTNNWWGNMIAYDTNTAVQPVWVNPYMVQIVADVAPFGLSVSYPYRSRTSGGSTGNSGAVQYYLHGNVKEFMFTATEFTSAKPTFQVVDWADHGVKVQLTSATSSGTLQSDLVSGMVYTTAKYTSLTPRLYTSAAILTVNGVAVTSSSVLTGNRFDIVFNSGQRWILYALTSDGTADKSISLQLDGTTALKSTAAWDGILRVALAIDSSWVTSLDKYKSCIVQSATVVINDDSSYQLNWSQTGNCNNGLVHFMATHQVETLDTTTGVAAVSGMVAQSTTRGAFYAYVTPSAQPVWKFKETQEVPSTDFYPVRKISSTVVAQQNILATLTSDINAAWSIPLDGSYYYNGKLAQKYASLCLVASDAAIVGTSTTLLSTCLSKLRTVMAPYLTNSWTYKLNYDRIYGGIISSLGITANDINADFGNTMYNDHHFHYGYWIYTAAIINYLDPTWSELSKLNTMTDLLVRDVANSDASDTYFPRFRSFDWFRGHSYSHGVTPFADGKDEESTSEDINFAYAMYLYGKATNNANTMMVGKLMTRLNAHAIKTYFLMTNANVIHPANFRPNKVTGIFFDNKVDYATWFSAEKYAIHGIQMLPVSPITEYVRTKTFVAEEWNEVLSTIPIVVNEDKTNAWLSLLYLNYATVNKSKALSVLQTATLDDGLTRTWALYMAASFAD